MNRVIFVIALLFIVIFAIYILGPVQQFDDFDDIPYTNPIKIDTLDQYLEKRNQKYKLKKDNGEKIIWADSIRRTEYSIVYLHGFSASHFEGSPIHVNLASALNANLFLTRLPKHGLNDSLAFLDLEPKELVDYAKEAIAIGDALGEKFVLMSCSTGGTLSSYLAGKDNRIDALVMYSPNFQMEDKNTRLLTRPWGIQLARLIKKGKYHSWEAPDEALNYWYTKYRLEGIAALQKLVEGSMNDQQLNSIDQPVYIAYYFKNEAEKDMTVSVDRILEVEALLKDNNKKNTFQAFDNGRKHVFISPIFNPDWVEVQDSTLVFLRNVFADSQNQQNQLISEPLIIE